MEVKNIMNNMYILRQKITDFFRYYGAYIIAVFLLFLITASVVLFSMLSAGGGVVDNVGGVVENPTITDTPVGSVASYSLPLTNPSICMGYFDNELVYNNSLKQWETHKSLDLTSTTSSNVMSIADGVVEKVYSNYLEGNVIVISHDNGLQSSYASLGDDISLKVGDKVVKGQVIATISDSAYSELNTGDHLHFTLYEGGVKIDPMTYLGFADK